MDTPAAPSKARPWSGVAVVAVILSLILLFGSAASQGTAPKAPGQYPRALPSSYDTSFHSPTVKGSYKPEVGLSYETRIPRPTVKGYYEPKVVPYPAGKPVSVNGYYRKNGTYVQPHFRSLPAIRPRR